MPVFIGQPGCWVCNGSGYVTTGTAQRRIVCGMCGGTGVADAVPTSSSEMAGMLARMPGVERRTLSAEEIEAAVARYGPIIEAAMREIEAEDAARTLVPATRPPPR